MTILASCMVNALAFFNAWFACLCCAWFVWFVFSLLTAFCGHADGVCCDPIAVKASETIGLSLTPDEIDLLRECMKRTEDYYRGLLLLKQDWNAEKNEANIAMIKIRLNMIDKLQEKTRYDGQSDYYKNLQ